jgi:hypothetical protein
MSFSVFFGEARIQQQCEQLVGQQHCMRGRAARQSHHQNKHPAA